MKSPLMQTEDKTPRCGNCIFYRADPGGVVRRCMLGPIAIDKNPNDWCGQFQPKTRRPLAK